MEAPAAFARFARPHAFYFVLVWMEEGGFVINAFPALSDSV